MESRKPSVDLGKELTCSICTELLYQPLTLLDCLHTYCGACLKEWFKFQAAKAARAPVPPTPDTVIFSCPSCRSRVRDTKHNATVVTLLDMYIAANPTRDRTDEDKQEAAAKYKPGDQVLPKVRVRERTAEERRADEEDQRLVDEVRQISLREAVAAGGGGGGGSNSQSSRPRHRGDSRSGDERQRSSRRHGSESSHRQQGDEGRQRRTENGGHGRERLASDARRPRSDSHSRQVEHQSSLRSLIGSQMSDREIEREIEDFARQIQEEGLLDGLDLDNIDLSRDDEFSRRITDAYRRRQRDRSRQEPARRSNASARTPIAVPVAVARPAEAGQDARLRPASRPHSRSRAHSRSRSGTESAVDERSRPPLSGSANLEVRSQEGRTRRRTTSGGSRSSTAPVPLTVDHPARPAARSQTDLTLQTEPRTETRTETSAPPAVLVSEPVRPGRSSSVDAVAAATAAQSPEILDAPSRNNASFSNRLPPVTLSAAGAVGRPSAAARPPRPTRPSNLVLSNSEDLIPSPLFTSGSPGRGQQRATQLFEEPSIACARCEKAHIEYDLHYSCNKCNEGEWDTCQECYRAGKGCLHWFGFGHGAWKKWEKRKQGDDSIAPPHILTAERYVRPSSTSVHPETGKTMTTEDPKTRRQTGTFCANCQEWSNECYWRCHVCNEGDWGFCNGCVNQGRSCSHKLLPLAHEDTTAASSQSVLPRSPGRPPTASMMSGPQAAGMGPFKPLSFNTRCDLCQDAILPAQTRLHCFTCTSTLVPEASPGDYDICASCYQGLEAQGRISRENGSSGWRRCLSGHRMAIVGFIEGKIGQWRYVERDIIGGRALRVEAVEDGDDSGSGNGEQSGGLEKWTWQQGSEKLERLVTRDVSECTSGASTSTTTTAPTTADSQCFPPDGGAGQRAHAKWPWFPKAGSVDELLFPRGAEIQEVRDLNGDWFFGTYMGAKGVFPAPYVQLES